jgi:hypothetical protein
LLVADEPTGNVDPEMAKRLLHLFDSLNKLGTTVVVATHDLHLISSIGRRDASPRPRPVARSDRGAAPPAAAGRRMSAGPRSFGAADRRLLPEGRLAGPMPWVIAIMMFLTVLAAAAGLGLGGAAASLGAGDRQPGHGPDRRAQSRPARGRGGAALDRLRRLPEVESVRRLPPAEMKALLEPWLGAGGARGRSADPGDDRRPAHPRRPRGHICAPRP